MSADRITRIANDFWNIRGSFELLGVVDLGTQASLVRRNNGQFVLLDTYSFSDATRAEVMKLTDNGNKLQAIFNLHPFHTLHVDHVAKLFPRAKLYGTDRHVDKAPSLRWEPERTNSPEFAQLFAEDFDFMVPAGVTFIPENENLHFASVLAFHKTSRTLHVDDTLTWVDLPLLGGLKFHPTLRWVLKPAGGAVREFQAWANELVRRCESVENLCTAHGKSLPPVGRNHPTVAKRVQDALSKVQGTLNRHSERYAR